MLYRHLHGTPVRPGEDRDLEPGLISRSARTAARSARGEKPEAGADEELRRVSPIRFPSTSRARPPRSPAPSRRACLARFLRAH